MALHIAYGKTICNHKRNECANPGGARLLINNKAPMRFGSLGYAYSNCPERSMLCIKKLDIQWTTLKRPFIVACRCR